MLKRLGRSSFSDLSPSNYKHLLVFPSGMEIFFCFSTEANPSAKIHQYQPSLSNASLCPNSGTPTPNITLQPLQNVPEHGRVHVEIVFQTPLQSRSALNPKASASPSPLDVSCLGTLRSRFFRYVFYEWYAVDEMVSVLTMPGIIIRSGSSQFHDHHMVVPGWLISILHPFELVADGDNSDTSRTWQLITEI
jgi:hypothetical protein